MRPKAGNPWSSFLAFAVLLFSLSSSPLLAQSYFTDGATQDEVVAAMGAPTRTTVFHALTEETWNYRDSTVDFRNGRVVGWDNAGNLRVSVGQAKTNAAPFAQGSNREDVIAAMGTPTRITGYPTLNEETWHYRYSTVGFKNGQVVEWAGFGTQTSVTSPRRIVDLATGVGVLEKSAPSLFRANDATLGVAENGSYYGQPNAVGVPKTVHVNGYFRKDGTYVRGHYRSSPGRSSGRR